MRKMILTLTLAIVSSVWMMSGAICLTQAPDELYWSFITVSGTIQWLGSPCEEGEECPPCVTPAIVTSDKTYYLSSSDQEVRDFLDHMETAPIPAIYLLPLQARASGTPYTQGSFDFLVVNNIDDLYVQYFSDQLTRIPSLCDEWNILEISNVTCGYCEVYRTYNSHLTTDTVIGGLLYSQLIEDGAYKGALREGNNRDIYCIPAGCSQEYLLYAFNAQVGDSLKNIWVGGYSSRIPDVRSAIVSEIKQTTPRTIELEVHYYEAPDAYEESIGDLTWIEGIGMPCGPMGTECSGFNGCADSRANILLCAYKNGEQVYTSSMGEQYGCVYNYNPYETPTDTIPLFSYTGDDSGSSTVDPVDPNQVVATLNGNQLTIHEYSGEEINYTLRHNTPAKMPAQMQTSASDTFRGIVTLQITESGEYQLVLTNPSWDYSIYGTFFYSPQGIEQITSSTQGGETSRLVLLNGQIYILRGEKVYTITGQKLK